MPKRRNWKRIRKKKDDKEDKSDTKGKKDKDNKKEKSDKAKTQEACAKRDTTSRQSRRTAPTHLASTWTAAADRVVRHTWISGPIGDFNLLKDGCKVCTTSPGMTAVQTTGCATTARLGVLNKGLGYCALAALGRR